LPVKARSGVAAPRLFSLGGSLVRVLHRDVQAPVHGHAAVKLVFAQRITRGNVAAVELEDGIDPGRPHGVVVRRPAKQRRVKLFRRALVGGGQFNPAEGARGMLVNLCHSGTSIRLGSPASRVTGDIATSSENS